MKDTNGKTITEEEFMKDIGHGVERTQENWKSFFEKFPEFYIKLRPEASMEISSEDWNNYEGRLKDFISTLLAEERYKVIEKLDAMAFENDDGYKVELFINWDKAKAELKQP